jgi:lysophospholipase L1-like esterase
MGIRSLVGVVHRGPAVLCVALFVAGLLVVRTAGDAVAAEPVREGNLLWYDAKGLGVEGRGWHETKSFYDRLPAKALGVVRKAVWGLSLDSAGICVRFVSDAATIHARWALRDKGMQMPHMPATGVSGVDLYVKDSEGRWRWLAVGQPKQFPVNSARLVTGLATGTREYMLYLPLYNGVSKVEVGVPAGSTCRSAGPRESGKRPIVFYGTSITQGGCASRPGMVHTAILGRWLDRPVINLGFSGNGKMEQELADLLAELDPSLYVLDCLPNMNSTMVKERVVPFVQTLRKARPTTPILLVEDRNYSNAMFVAGPRARNRANQAELRAALDRLKTAGVRNLHYLPADTLLGDDLDNEATVDGSHPTDLGFMRQAEAFREALKKILE